MSETNELSVEQRIAELDRYVNEAPKSGTPATEDIAGGVVIHVSTHSFQIAISNVFLVGGGLLLIVTLGILIGTRFRRGRN